MPTDPNPADYIVRQMIAEDAPAVSDCIRRVYGDAYPRAELYQPDEIVRRNQTGEWYTVVALDASSQVVGHSTLERFAARPLGEMCGGVVLPGHRGHFLPDRFRIAMVEECERLGLAGAFSDIRIDSAAAQGMANRSRGRYCALTLGLWPNPQSSEPGEPAPSRRLDFLFCFRYFRPPPKVVAYAPSHHPDMLARTYAQFDVPVEFRSGEQPLDAGRVTVVPSPEYQHTVIQVQQVGATTPTQVEHADRDFEADARLRAAYLELPLAQPGTAEACTHAERLGYFYSGIGPYYFDDGDALRLQRLKYDPLFERMRPSHPFAQELLAYVRKDWERIRGQ